LGAALTRRVMTVWRVRLALASVSFAAVWMAAVWIAAVSHPAVTTPFGEGVLWTSAGAMEVTSSVAKGSPILATTSSAGVALGGSVTAGGTLSGGMDPTGVITFRLYGPDDAACAAAAVFTSAVGVSGNRVYASGSFTPAAPGTYRWRADYSGDANNTAASAPCSAPGGSVVVAKGSPILATTSSAGVALGGSVSSSATLAGGVNPTGAITFRLYGPDDGTCAAGPVFTSAVGVSGSPLYASGSFTPAAPGTYRWRADYSGDVNNTAASAPCNAPGGSVVVAKGSPMLTTTAPVGLAPYNPAAHAGDIVDLEVAAFALLTALRSSATGRAASQPQRRDSEGSDQEGELVSVEVDNEDRWVDVVAGGDMMSAALPIMRGDRSGSWRWPATVLVDRVSLKVPERIAPVSPLLARVINDAGYLRAILGSASALLLIVGVWLGIVAVRNVHGEALPPEFSLAMALAVLGVFDALAGLIAVAVFGGGVVLLGGLSSADAVRTLLGLASLWFAAPLIAGAARPLRRAPTVTLAEHWDRLADIVIASLVGAWAVQKILQGLPGLSGLELPIADQANTAALVVLAALAVRMMIETLAAHWYPMRLSQVQPAELPGSRVSQYLAAKALTLTIFLFAAVSYVGFCWQLYVGAILFILPQVLELWEDRFPNSPKLHIILPRGIVQIVALLVVGAFVGNLILSNVRHSQELIRESFVLLSLPGFALSLLELAGREGPDRELHWRDQIMGTIVLVTGVLLVLGLIRI
jgi:hypothetical protein